MKKANFEAQPMIIDGCKAWHIGKDKEGKEVYQLEKGYLKIKNGRIEYGEEVDDEGNFVKKPKKTKEEGKKADGHSR